MNGDIYLASVEVLTLYVKNYKDFKETWYGSK